MPSRVELARLVRPKAALSAERSSVRYATAQTASAGGRVTVICDGSDEAVTLSTAETIAQGQRVRVVSQGGTWMAVCLGDGSIGGAMLTRDGVFDQVVADSVTANVVKTNILEAVVADIGTVNSDVLNAITAHINLADIGTATIDQAWVQRLMVQSGLVANEGTVFSLVAVKIDAADIATGTLTVDRLIVRGSDGEYYFVQPKAGGGTENTKLEGSALKKNSVAADRIIANSITTRELTVQDIVGTGGWINLKNGTFGYANASTGDAIAWDGQHLTIRAEALNALFGGGNLLLDTDVDTADAVAAPWGRYIWDATATGHNYGSLSDANRALVGCVHYFRWSWAAGTSVARNTASNYRWYVGNHVKLVPGQTYHIEVWSYGASVLVSAGAQIRCSLGLAAAETLSGEVEMCYGDWQAITASFKKYSWDVKFDGVVPASGIDGYRVTFYAMPNSSGSAVTVSSDVRIYLAGFSMRTESSYLSVDGDGLHVKTDGTSEALLDGDGLHVKGSGGGTLADFVGTGMRVYDDGGTQQLVASGTRGLRKRNTAPHALSTESDAALTTEPTYAVMGGVLLFVNSSGTTSAITLQRTKADFAFMEIQYGDGTRIANKRIYCSTTGSQRVMLDRIATDGTTVYAGCAEIQISGTAVTWTSGRFGQGNVTSGATAVTSTNPLKIYRIIGWT